MINTALPRSGRSHHHDVTRARTPLLFGAGITVAGWEPIATVEQILDRLTTVSDPAATLGDVVFDWRSAGRAGTAGT